jgi:hypothetical protein
VHRPIPPGAHDLGHSFRIVLVRFVDPHHERGTGVSRVEADDVEGSPAQLMDEPRRHGARLDSDAGTISRMPPHDLLDLLRVRMTLATPQLATRIIHNTDRRQFL